MKVEGIGEKLSQIISSKDIKKDVKRHLKYMNDYNIDIISIEDKEYPFILKQINNPPLNLYIRGNKKTLEMPAIAIVGCRDATEYGKNVAQHFSSILCENNFCIVSGLARGIDYFAHLGAVKQMRSVLSKDENYSQMLKNKILDEKGCTIAVLGNGLDRIYPLENAGLAKEILNTGGAIISEYPLGCGPKRENFPARNRIISGLCNGVLVVEAKPKSGTMITVDFALEQGRDVFVIPGNIDSVNSLGTNELIRQGAKLVTAPNEIIDEYKRR